MKDDLPVSYLSRRQRARQVYEDDDRGRTPTVFIVRIITIYLHIYIYRRGRYLVGRGVPMLAARTRNRYVFPRARRLESLTATGY